jgi:CRISPR-associated protein Csd1
MILQALIEYYNRMTLSDSSSIACEGFEFKEISYIIVIDKKGSFIRIDDMREEKKIGKRSVLRGHIYLVPRSVGRSGKNSYQTTFLLWDHIGYVLGLPSDDEISFKQNQTWVNRLNKLKGELKNNEDVLAMIKFYTTNKKMGIDKAKAADIISECLKTTSCNMAFRIDTEFNIIPCSSDVKKYVEKSMSCDNNYEIEGLCLVTGNKGIITRIHSDIFISKDSKKFISFQKNSGYDSYGKTQGYNAPIAQSSEFAYSTALKTLLKFRSSNNFLIGDLKAKNFTRMIFWSAKQSELENNFALFFDLPSEVNPDAGTVAVKALCESIEKGAFSNDEGKQEFYVLGLSPNAARIAVRFFIKDTVKGMSENIYKHFKDLEIFGKSNFLSLFKLLVSTAVKEETNNIVPHLAGDFMMSILQGLPYPQTLLQSVVNRIQTEQKITYPRAALIKAYLNRLSRYKKQKEEITVKLDMANTNIGYVLGRLFATLEKLQADAQGDTNSTIMRYYSSASSTPIIVFANLIRLHHHHLDKLSKSKVGHLIYFEKLIGEIVDKISINGNITYPTHLSLINQGNFSIGYYHQRQDFFTKKDDKTNQAVGDNNV